MKRLSLLSALILASSCLQPVSEDGGVHPDELALDDYCDAFEEYRTCINPRQCGVAATDVSCERIGHNPMSRHSVNCIDSLLLSIDAGLLRYDAKAARSCLDRRAASCNDDSECTGAFLPTRALGETCIGTLDCIDGACDRSTSCPGTCVPLSKEGETFGAVGGCEAGLSWARLVDGGTRCQEGGPWRTVHGRRRGLGVVVRRSP